MELPSYMQSIVDRNIVMRRIPIYLESVVCGEVTALLHSRIFCLCLAGLPWQSFRWQCIVLSFARQC